MFAAYAWTLSFSDEPYHGLNLKANYAFHESTETYTSVKGWVVVTSIQDSARISIPRLTYSGVEDTHVRYLLRTGAAFLSFEDGVSIQRSPNEGCLTLSGYDKCLSSVSIGECSGSTRGSPRGSVRGSVRGRHSRGMGAVRAFACRESIRRAVRAFVVP
ncbi:uncharacterized protein LAJ45_11460 [Morchella importuna]|uniref:uncharacterized protein n=1 Tax=Morchella importuna TaxID=1174673 RepID=UPI001E8DDC32|nr:uncharacterized protein LAJ45_11460 [Morchella importuna]KAH8144563.1 hypothetical protein LAJ45_11460 [Morchella importuna]